MTNLLLKVPLALALGAYLSGMALGHLLAGHYVTLLFGISLILGLSGLILAVLMRRSSFWQAIGYILIVTGFIPLGWGNYIRSQELPANHVSRFFDPDQQTQLTGRLTKPPEYLGNRYYLYLEAEQVEYRGGNVPVQGLVRLNCYLKGLDLEYGERVRLWARLNYPKNYENPGGFDYKAYLARHGIRVVGSVVSGTSVEKLGMGAANPFWQAIYRLKTDIDIFIHRNCPQPQAGLIRMMVWGERYALDSSVKLSFDRIGLAYLLAISGLHVSFLSLLVFGFFQLAFRLLPSRLYERLVNVIRPRKLAAILSIPVVIFYTMITGASNSAVRACSMILTLLVAVILNRQRQLFNTLALAALIILLWNPQSIREVDFQLSFVCVFFILCAFYTLKSPSPQPSPPRERGMRWGYRLKEYIVVSVAAYMAALPISVFYFYELSPWGVLSSLTGIPFLWPIVPLGLVSGVISPLWPGIALALMKLNLVFVNILLKLVEGINRLPYASFKLAPPDVGWLVFCYVLLLGIWWLARRSWIYLVLGATLWGGIWFLNATDMLVPPIPPGQGQALPLQVTFLDVGQGEAIFIRLPDGRCMMVDGGGSLGFDIGEQVISPYLWHEKVKKIDIMLMTHHHPDHIKGLFAVVRNFKVGECWQSPAECTTPVYMELNALVEAKGIPVRRIAAGDEFSWPGGIKLHFLHPPRNPDRPFGRDADTQENNSSLVFIMEYGQIKILFAGDIGWQVEKYLVRRQTPLACTVLKAPHHGSLSSSTPQFLDAANPAWAVFSRRPPSYKWRHNTEIFSRYEERHIKIWRTDVNGAVTLYTNGKDLRFIPECSG